MGAGWTGSPPIEAAEGASLDAARKQAVHRRRRIIYNDGNDIWAKGADSVEKFLALRHEPLLGTQVDSTRMSSHGSW